jgi:hypothetical protein
VNSANSLELLLLIAEKEPNLYERAAVRWGGRFFLQHRPALADSVLAVTALGATNERRPDARPLVMALLSADRRSR